MWNWVEKLSELRADGLAVAVVTVTSISGSTPCGIASKLLALVDGRFFGTIGGGNLESLVLRDAHECLCRSESKAFRYPLGATAGQCCGGVVEVIVEVLGVGPRLYLFGAGHVGQSVVRVLDGTPFEVHVIDERAEWLEKLPRNAIRHTGAWDEFVEHASWDSDKTFVAVMTHRHDLDQAIVEAILDKPAKYLGLIGSDVKWRRFRERLIARGKTETALSRVRCPLGIDIGGKSPAEVAVSLAAEIIGVMNGR